MQSKASPFKYHISTLGCPKNQNDSQFAMGVLDDAGFIEVESPEDADFIIVNTCGFIEDAKKESISKIFEMAELKRSDAKLVVSGCLAQRYAEELAEEMTEADLFVGVNEYAKLPEILLSIGNDESKAESENHTKKIFVDPCDLNYLESTIRKIGENPYTETIKIAEGCNNRCTYCVIPAIRGNYRSKRMEDILKEAKSLSEKGCKEIVLIAQDVTYYGRDIYGEYKLPELLTKLEEIPGIEWIRLLYCYDDRITDELISVIKNSKKVCHYIDIPLQHASNKVLYEMNRKSTNESIREVIGKLRREIPDIAIRTTFIVGFPGETEEDYEDLVNLVEDIRFDRLGVFAYSREEETPAGEREDQVEADIKERRLDGIMTRQMDISLELNKEKIGKVFKVLVDESQDDGSYIGRTVYDAPEIDNGVIFTSERELKSGDMVDVIVVDAFDYDLVGEEFVS
ncbi:MAG: 30S ribosomal protein S12 methylthiotransferase RimO [Firmicutes bacterium]|nr:30S ribosomal protein S12 methylthiotransferase RimO [Bacillota bacterium]